MKKLLAMILIVPSLLLYKPSYALEPELSANPCDPVIFFTTSLETRMGHTTFKVKKNYITEYQNQLDLHRDIFEEKSQEVLNEFIKFDLSKVYHHFMIVDPVHGVVTFRLYQVNKENCDYNDYSLTFKKHNKINKYVNQALSGEDV